MTDDMDARARVKRLEAALRETRERIAPHINMGTIRHGFDLLVKIDKALATSPPEGERGSARVEGGVVVAYPSNKNAPHTPQAHGDALAALNWLTKNAGRHVDEQSADSQRAIVLDELTASGVPYVPEGYKLVPVQMTREMRKAFWQAHDEYECPEDYGKQVGPEAPQHQWDAVLAAAPSDGGHDD